MMQQQNIRSTTFVNPKTLLPVIHYTEAGSGRTLCGKRVGASARLLTSMPWERRNEATCEKCKALDEQLAIVDELIEELDREESAP
jgi:hypothetical protein